MTSHYRNTICVVYLFFCVFIASESTGSFIRQFTDLQQGPIKNLDVADYLQKNQEISSRDYKVSPSSIVKGLRSRPPLTYTIKMESFNTVLKSTTIDKYEAHPFTVGEYNWTFVVYPNGNKNDNGTGYLSLYVAIDNSTLTGPHQEVYADLRFYIFNNKEKKYFTIQDTDVWRYNIFKNMWGFSQVLPLDTFKDPNNGYLYDGDHCQFGVDVTIPTPSEKSELFSIAENFHDAKFTWTIRNFSTLIKDYYRSDAFFIGGRNLSILVYPNGYMGEGKDLSMFLALTMNDPYEQGYLRAKFRALNQLQLNNLERPLEVLFKGPGYTNGWATAWGYPNFISLAYLKDSSKGFLVNDELMLQVEMEAISSTKYFPS